MFVLSEVPSDSVELASYCNNQTQQKQEFKAYRQQLVNVELKKYYLGSRKWLNDQ
jgi:hypothetical protein